MSRSILQDWVMELPIREQGTLLSAVRGCDLTPKFPLDAPERRLVAYVRWCFLIPADEREVDYQSGSFMSRVPPPTFRPSCVGHYPLHWVTHIMHALEVIGYRHPDESTRETCYQFYAAFCDSLHVRIEPIWAMTDRLSEDRIAKGDVVS